MHTMNTDSNPCFTIHLRISGELRFFLKGDEAGDGGEYRFSGKRSVKDLVESMGIPHTEVGHILINGTPSAFSALVEDGQQIEVLPYTLPRRLDKITLLLEHALPGIRFVLDVHLGTLARRLRMLGFDTRYSWKMNDPELAQVCEEEKRILLTRDLRLLMRRNVHWGMYIRNKYPVLQTAEVLNGLGLWEEIKLFSRCINCNGLLYRVEQDSPEYNEVIEQLPEGVTCWCKEYSRCESCSKIYWEGSHFDKMESKISEIYRYRF